jgi:hypothetical protein
MYQVWYSFGSWPGILGPADWPTEHQSPRKSYVPIFLAFSGLPGHIIKAMPEASRLRINGHGQTEVELVAAYLVDLEHAYNCQGSVKTSH